MHAPDFEFCLREDTGVSMHGAYVYCRGKLIASATNSGGRSLIHVAGIPVIAPSVHAEMAALSQVRFSKGETLHPNSS